MDKLTSYNIREVADKVNALVEKKSEIINATSSTLTLTRDDSGKTIVLDRALGVAVALPISEVGLKFRFVVKTTASGGTGYVMTAGKTSDLYIGAVTMIDTDTSDTHTDQVPDASDDDVMTLNGGTTGGVIGSYFDLECIALGRWWVSGVLRHTGNVATPFA